MAKLLSKIRVTWFVFTGLLVTFVFIINTSGQGIVGSNDFRQAQLFLDNGNFPQAIKSVQAVLAKSTNSRDKLLVSKSYSIIASAQISLGNFKEAVQALDSSLELLPENKSFSLQKALIYIQFAQLHRAQFQFGKAVEYSKKAIAIAPENRLILGEHYLNLGRIMFASGFDISAVIWLEKAEEIFNGFDHYSGQLDTYKYLTLAWFSKLDFSRAIKYGNKWKLLSQNTRFKYKHRESLFELATIFSASGQKHRAFQLFEEGLNLSKSNDNNYQSKLFLSSLIFNSLFNQDLENSERYLKLLEKSDPEDEFLYEVTVGKAVLSGFKGNIKESNELFVRLEKMKSSSKFFLLYWQITIDEFRENWESVLKLNHDLLELTTKNNFRDDLPGIYLNIARANFHLNKPEKSLENLNRSLSLIEEIRRSENSNLSLSLFETYHKAYRLFVQLKLKDVQESFELADFLKARFLRDRINNSVFKDKTIVSPATLEKLEELSVKFIDDQSVAQEIEKHEKLITTSIPNLELNKPDLTKLNDLADLNNTAIISYFFTLDKKLLAYVWEKNQPLRIINLTVSESEIEVDAKTTHQKIRNFIFFKRDGKKLYDKLLKPLSLKAKHLIIIPDKSLWKIPFQALSPDGKNYLIEEKLISYSPSISILLDQLKKPTPNRQSFQAFANSTFENKSLQYVNSEAKGVAEIYKTKPILNATIRDFEKLSGKSDINHFSMHAQVANEQPLESFLAFRKNEKGDGRLTVEEILDIKLKQGSLAFLASCDTTNVLNGEGLVSLSWAMMAAGATTVISAQWEANDKSTEVFTKSFYENYKKGSSSAEALQNASLELIQNKSNNMHEPYYWAEFTLNGDFR